MGVSIVQLSQLKKENDDVKDDNTSEFRDIVVVKLLE